MSSRIRGFDGLRAIAVLMVFMHHKLPIKGIDLGREGVWIFFCLSGFLIIGILSRSRLACDRGTSEFSAEIRKFFWRRSWRIFPIYYIVLILVTAVDLLSVAMHKNWSISNIQGLPYAYAYLSNIWLGCIHQDYDAYLTHLWSLSIEEQFYLLAAPILLLFAARHHVRLCAVLCTMAVLLHIYLRVSGYSDWMIHTFSFNNFAILLFGGLCYFYSAGEGRFGALPSAVSVALLSVIVVRDLLGLRVQGFELALTEIAQIGLTGLIVLAVAQNQSSIATRLLEWRPLAYLGKISYGFYLFHPFVPNIGKHDRLAPIFGAAGPLIGAILAFSISVVLAHLSWSFIEKRLLAMKDSKLSPSLYAERAS